MKIPRSVSTTKNLFISRSNFQRAAKKITKIYNPRAQLLLCSLNFLFGDVLVALVVKGGSWSCLTENYWSFHKSRDIKSAINVSRRKNGHFSTQLTYNLWILKITTKHRLVRCLYHLSASCSARSKKNPSKNAKRDDCPVTVKQYC